MPAPAAKRARLEERIRAVAAETLLAEIQNPLAREATVTYVRLSPDGSYARAYIDCLDRKRAKIVAHALNAAAGVFRTALAKKLSLYRPPRIVFAPDAAIDAAARVDDLLGEIAREDGER